MHSSCSLRHARTNPACDTTCSTGQYLQASDCSCQPCGSNEYQASNNFVGNSCQAQPSCTKGEKYTLNSNKPLESQRTCNGCDAGTYQDGNNHRDPDCIDQTVSSCGTGKRLNVALSTKTEVLKCEACTGDTYQSNGAYTGTSCTDQPFCTSQGQRMSGTTVTAARTCSGCPSNTYQSSNNHRSTTCTAQTECGEGQLIDADSKTQARECSGCPTDTWQDDTQHRETACKPSTACAAGRRFDGTNSVDSTCPVCGANTYQNEANHYKTTCKNQPFCAAGQKMGDADNVPRNAVRECGDCEANTYQTSTQHRSTICTGQPTCSAGQRMSGDTKSAKRTCSACPEFTYQVNTGHRDTECSAQTTCGQGQGFRVGMIQNGGVNTPGTCPACVAGGSSGQYHDGTGHREICKTQRTCAEGFTFSGDNTVFGTCRACDAGTYQDVNGGRVTVCTPQKTCTRGQRAWEGQCIPCSTGTFIDKDSHREKTCSEQIKCQPGDIFRSTAQTDYGDCDQKCQGDTYQDKRNHRELTCIAQRTCGTGTKISAYTIKAIRTCPGCDSNTYRDSVSHRRTTCIDQPFCGKGQKMSTDTKTARRTCPGCESNTYQNSGQHRSVTCITQKQCSRGQQINKDSTTEIRKCSMCPANTYQTSWAHRQMVCNEQPTCNEGQFITSDTFTARRVCQECGKVGNSLTYQIKKGHRELNCIKQTTCPKGQRLDTMQRTKRAVCRNCIAGEFQPLNNHQKDSCTRCGLNAMVNDELELKQQATRRCSGSEVAGTYTYQGTTRDGKPYYVGGDRYLYHDAACDGGTANARWIVDTSKPSTTATSDLDADGDCAYVGRIDSSSGTPPAGTNVWKIACAGSFTDVTVEVIAKGKIECSKGEYLSGECNRAGQDSLRCNSCVEHEYGDTVHAAIVGNDLTKPDGDRYPCKPCEVVCPIGQYPKYESQQRKCAARSTSNHATCVECSVGMWGRGTRNQKVKRKDNDNDWDRELAWCQVCGTTGEVYQKGDDSEFNNVYIVDQDRLKDQTDPGSTAYGVQAANPGFYQNVPGQGECKQCRTFCPRGQTTTGFCTSTTKRICNDKVAPRLCTTAEVWKYPWSGPLAPWKGPIKDGDCALPSTKDVLQFEAVLDPFEIASVATFTRSKVEENAGTDPTTCFDPGSETMGDEDLTIDSGFVRKSRDGGKFISLTFPFAADTTILKEPHYVDYTCKDGSENVAAAVFREVEVKDTVAPTLVLCNVGDDDAVCGNAMPTDKECPLQHGSDAAGLWKSWVGGITSPIDHAATQFNFDVSENIQVGDELSRKAMTLASYKAHRDDSNLAWIAACDVCDRKATAGRPDGGFGSGLGRCGNSAATTATTITDDNSIDTVGNRIADWTDVKSFYTGGDRPTTGNAEIVYRLKDSSKNEGSISRKVILFDGTPPELFPHTGPDPDPENPTFDGDPHPYTNPEVLEAIAKGSPTTYADHGARIEDVVEAELDQAKVLQVRSGAVRGDGDQELAQAEGEAFDLTTVSPETAWKDGVAGITNARVGRYKVEYSAADSAGNVGTAQRWVVVEDTTPPEITVEWPVKDGVHGPGVNGTDIFMSIPNLGQAGWANFGVPWEEPGVAVADTHLLEDELRKTVEIWTSNSANTSAPSLMCCKGWAEECTQRANMTKCVDTELLEAGVPAIGTIYTLIYKMTDYSEDDALLVPGRTPNVATEKKRTVVIADRLPPILELQTGAALGFEDATTTTGFTIVTHVGKLNKKKEDMYDGNKDGEVVIHGGYVYLNPTLSLEDAQIQNPRAAIKQVFDCTVPAVVKGKDRGDCEEGINFVPTAGCSTKPGRCAPRLIAPFEDPGFTFTDMVDTHNGAAKLQSLTNGGIVMVSAPDLEEIRTLCKRSRSECSTAHRNKAYVGGLGEAGYLPAPGVQVGSTDMTANFTVAGVFTLGYAMIDANGNFGSATRTITVVRDEKPTSYKFDSYDASTSTFNVDLQSGGGVTAVVIILFMLLIILVLCYFSRKRLFACISRRCKSGGASELGMTGLPSTTNPTFAFEAEAAASEANSSQLAKKNAKSKAKQPTGNGKGKATGNEQSAPLPSPEAWFHGEISRKEAEKRIRAASQKEGVYLIRTKTEAGGGESFVLSLRAPRKKMLHYVLEVPQAAGEEFMVQTKPVNLPWVKSLRDLVVHLQTETSKLIATKLKHPAPIPSNGSVLMVQAAAHPTSSGQTVEENVYAMISDDPETFSINETYFGHPTGVYYRMFYPLERVEPLEVYTRRGESGGLPDGSPTDVSLFFECSV